MTEKMRKTADKVERFERRNSDWLWRDATTITRAVVELRDAADTIDYLRNTCNDLQSENAKLQESYDNLSNATWDRANSRAIDFMEEDELRATCADLYDHIDELKALVRDMYTCINHVTGTDAHWDCTTCPLDGTRECDFEGRLITLGIEVDGAPDDPPMSDAARRVFNRLMDELGGDGDESR